MCGIFLKRVAPLITGSGGGGGGEEGEVGRGLAAVHPLTAAQ